jgi:glycerate dehydrogenase
MNIVILDGYTVNPGDNPWDAVAALGELVVHDRTPDELKLERAQDADILLISKVAVDAATLAALPRLKYISLLATGYNNVDVAAAGARGIPVANVPAYSTESVAQTAFALLLEMATGAGRFDRAVKGGEWCASRDFCLTRQQIVELDGLTLGIIGYGAIGRAVARIGAAFGMQIIAYTPHVPADPGPVPVTFCELDEVFRRADVVTLHCPLTADNAGFVDSRTMGLMKRSAFLLNLARGALVNEADLARALHEGVIAGAGVDVVAVEPMLPDNPLLTAPNCVMTPHIAWASLAARKRLVAIVAANVASFLKGESVNVVNRQFLG